MNSSGRKPKDGIVRSKSFSFRATDEEKERWKKLAKAEGLTLAEWIRSACEIRMHDAFVNRNKDAKD